MGVVTHQALVKHEGSDVSAGSLSVVEPTFSDL
jgi:hypothetical protein